MSGGGDVPRKRRAQDPGGVPKPASVARDPFKSAKWDELTDGRRFRPSDAPTLTLLVQWHAIVNRCIEDMDEAHGQVAYSNDMSDLKALPQIGIMKQASAEIRALNKQLGINDEADGGEAGGEGDVLTLVTGGRQARRARASG